MADNTTLNAGTGGDTIAADDVTTLNGIASSNVKVQRVKVMYGTDGTATDVDATNRLPVSTGTVTTGAEKAEDAAHASGDTGTFVLAVRNANHATLTSAEGDYSPIAVDAEGCVLVVGDIPDGTTDTGAAVKIGAFAEANLSTSGVVADGQRTSLHADIDGVLYTKPLTSFGDILSQRVADASGTATAFSTFGATAGVRNYATTIAVYNDSTTNCYVDFRDGTGGTILFTMPAPSKGGSITNFTVPLRQPTANTALAYDVSAAVSGGSVYISVIGFKSPA